MSEESFQLIKSDPLLFVKESMQEVVRQKMHINLNIIYRIRQGLAELLVLDCFSLRQTLFHKQVGLLLRQIASAKPNQRMDI